MDITLDLNPTVRLITSFYVFAKNCMGIDFLEIPLSFSFFPFEWLVTALLLTLQISNVWWPN